MSLVYSIHIYTSYTCYNVEPPPVEPPNSLGPPPNRLERRSKATSFQAVVSNKKKMSSWVSLGDHFFPIFQNPHPTLVPSSPAAPKLRRMLHEMTWNHSTGCIQKKQKKMPPWEVGLHRYGFCTKSPKIDFTKVATVDAVFQGSIVLEHSKQQLTSFLDVMSLRFVQYLGGSPQMLEKF